MKKAIIIGIVLCIAGAAVSFGDVTISELRGKVEIRSPGASWEAAEVGMRVGLDDTISTGFNSTAVLSLGANNVIVSPLTRMSIDAFLEREEQVDTKLYLQVGAVRAQVDDSGEKRQQFSISSPYSTASVRGTVFEFDGLTLRVVRGSVALLLSPTRRPVRARGAAGSAGADGETGAGEGTGDGESGGTVVKAGQTVEIDVDFAGGTAIATADGRGKNFTTDPSSQGSGGGRGPQSDDGPGRGNRGGGPPAVTRGSVFVDWDWED